MVSKAKTCPIASSIINAKCTEVRMQNAVLHGHQRDLVKAFTFFCLNLHNHNSEISISMGGVRCTAFMFLRNGESCIKN